MVAESMDAERRSVLGIAKATYTVSEDGVVALDRTDPMPVYTKDVDTRYGVLPREDIPRLDPVFEVMVLGSAYAPGGQAVDVCEVALAVGDISRRLNVHGDRYWTDDSDQATPGKAVPFTRMPLGWHLAFGGTEEVEIDEDSFVDVADPINPLGKGFDYKPQVEQLTEALRCPSGFPRYNRLRALPNIESVAHPVTGPSDKPLPMCWAPCVMSSGIIIERMRRAQKAAGDDEKCQAQAVTLESPLMLHRAHPDWVIDTPSSQAQVVLSGMTPKVPLTFQLPELRVILDVSVAQQTRAAELHPSALTLFPDLRKFTLVYRGVIPYRYRASDKRMARVRLDTGWVPAARQASAACHSSTRSKP